MPVIMPFLGRPRPAGPGRGRGTEETAPELQSNCGFSVRRWTYDGYADDKSRVACQQGPIAEEFRIEKEVTGPSRDRHSAHRSTC